MDNYRIYLTEQEIPTHYYNLRADMEKKPAPLLNPGTMQPMTAEELAGVFCEELVAQELDNDTRYIEIPGEIREYYKIYRPSPVVRAYNLEKQLGTPAAIYFKFEGNNTSGSHKLNSATAWIASPGQPAKICDRIIGTVNGAKLWQDRKSVV